MKKQQTIEKNKICFVIAYFGPFPIWFPAFLLSCKNNPNIQWLIWHDSDTANINHPENVTFVSMTLDEFTALAVDLLDTVINIGTPHKLCDFKPIYGDLFKDQLTSFEYWGHCDLDLIWGDIESFLIDISYTQFDIISTRKHSICGHFTLYKNTNKINKLYTQVGNFKKAFLIPSYSGFDEGFFAHKLFQENQQPNPPFRIFWPKKYSVDWPELNVKPKGWRWENGKIIDKKGNERIYLHFMKWKKTLNRIDFKYEEAPTKFLITENGIWSKKMSFAERIQYAMPTHWSKLVKYYWTRLVFIVNHRILKKPVATNPSIPEGYKTL